MPNLPWRASGAVPPGGDDPLDALLTTGRFPRDAAPGLEYVEEVLAALRVGPSTSEFAGKARAMAEFRRTVGRSSRPRTAQPWSLATLRARAGFRFAAAAAAVVVVVVAVAYTGSLPAPLQKVAHSALAAPAAQAGPGVPAGTGRRASGRAVPHPGTAAGITGTSAGHDPERLGHPAGKGPQDSRHDRSGDHSGNGAGRMQGQASQGQGSSGRGWPGPTAARWPGSSAGVAPRPPALRGSTPRAEQRAGGQADKQSVRASTAASSRTHVPSHREAACGSAPGAKRSSPSHPPNLSGQNGGC